MARNLGDAVGSLPEVAGKMTENRHLSQALIGWSFIIAAALLWGGWMLLSPRIGMYFAPGDFPGIHARLTFWIWCYRFHIFGHVFTAIALAALLSQLTKSDARIFIWPGIVVAIAGTFVTTLGAAFYYHHGAWGAMEVGDSTPVRIAEFIESLRVDTEYTTCLVRFGRVFTGLGLLLLGVGLFRWKVLPSVLSGSAVAIGLAAMALTMGMPDAWSLYVPIFHAKALWLLAMGLVFLRSRVPQLD